MSKLKVSFEPHYIRDIKRIKKKHYKIEQLIIVENLILENSDKSIRELLVHHNMHSLIGRYSGCTECHVCNAGDWLVVWKVEGNCAIFLRTGTHDDIFL